MALISPNKVVKQWSAGPCDKAAIFAILGCTTGDTVDVGLEFTIVKQAIVLATTVAVAFTASIAGTILTMPSGLSNDGVYLLVWGVSA